MSDLEEARKSLIVHLAEVRELFEERAEGWEFALISTLKEYGRLIEIDTRLLDPLQQLLFDTHKGRGPGKPIDEAAIDSSAAAAVTVLKERGEPRNVGEAVRKVARLAGLDAKKLSRFRSNLSSGRRSGNIRPEIIQNYDFALGMLQKLPTTAVLDFAIHLKRFVR